MAENQNKIGNGNARNDALLDLVEQVQNENTRKYIADRLVPQMEWHNVKKTLCW